MNSLHSTDYIIFLVYFLVVAAYGLFIYYKKKKATVSASHDYFLAEGSLTWWAIGTSLIASNISAEQFVAMSGDGFKLGLAIASYEWMAAATLIIVAIFFIPVYLKNKIYTMPQFLSQRYNSTVAMIMAVFWLLLYIVVNLTSILYLGALAVSSISGIGFWYCMIGLAVFALLISLGGMKVIGYTDVIQVVFLIFGGLATTYLALNLVSDHFGGSNAWDGLKFLKEKAPDHFHMIFKQDNEHYSYLPGLSIIIGGMWIANLNYWGCNQYITQRALGADLKTARAGLLFASFLKLLMPLIVVLPGIAVYLLYKENTGIDSASLLQNGEVRSDRAYPTLLNILPTGLKGLSFAALTAAIVASLAGKVNSIATIFTLDIYKKNINPNASEAKMVWVGRVSILVAIIIAIIISPFLGIDKQGGFEFIQRYTGFVSPGIFAMFILGFFWKKTSSNAAIFATIGGFIMSVLLTQLPKWGLANFGFLSPIGFSKLVKQKDGSMIYEIPFLDSMFLVFSFCVIGMVIISLRDQKRGIVAKGLDIDRSMFAANKSFIAGALLVLGILTALYTLFW